MSVCCACGWMGKVTVQVVAVESAAIGFNAHRNAQTSDAKLTSLAQPKLKRKEKTQLLGDFLCMIVVHVPVVIVVSCR